MSSLHDELGRATWFHSYEIVPGVWTPGRTGRIDPRAVLSDLHGVPDDLSGKRALDIGALDGPYSFELRRRGADVTALDIQDPDRTGFNTAQRILRSDVRYVQGDVYDLDTLFSSESFDLILYFGVWYHLKSPVLAFERINRALKRDGMLAAEGECLLNFIGPDGTEEQARTLSASPSPISLYFPRGFKGDRYTWYLPNPACVEAWLDSTSFQVTHRSFEDYAPHQRMRITATKTAEPVAVDNPVW